MHIMEVTHCFCNAQLPYMCIIYESFTYMEYICIYKSFTYAKSICIYERYVHIRKLIIYGKYVHIRKLCKTSTLVWAQLLYMCIFYICTYLPYMRKWICTYTKVVHIWKICTYNKVVYILKICTYMEFAHMRRICDTKDAHIQKFWDFHIYACLPYMCFFCIFVYILYLHISGSCANTINTHIWQMNIYINCSYTKYNMQIYCKCTSTVVNIWKIYEYIKVAHIRKICTYMEDM